MTETPMTSDRWAQIRNRKLDEVTAGPWLVADDENGQPLVYVETLRDGRTGARVLLVADGASEADMQFAASARNAVPDLLAEVDRLRTALSDGSDQVAERDDEIGSLSARLHHLDRNALPELRREVEHHKDGKARWRGRAEKAEARVAELEERLHDAAMARVWTNEDGKKFVFVDDLKGPLLGTTPVEAAPPALRGRARLDAKTVAEAEATHWKRLGIDPSGAADLAEGLAGVEYGIATDNEYGQRVLDPSPDLTESLARLARCQQMWPNSRLVQRTVRAGEWTEVSS
ncbi:hypothetical protein ACGFZA_07785 [Streptomyces sp. NPDC048211]|uniref:hypothetical protein n=1 Tax=Streptomyces sp. NPDC048211 TaxID=3365516 RepID=UPI00371CFEBB